MSACLIKISFSSWYLVNPERCTSSKMKSFKILTFATLMSFVLLFALISQQQTGVQAGKKKMMKNALMAALLLHGGKKILFPFPIPIPVPVLKQTQPVYYEQPSYNSYGGGHY